MTTSNIVHPDLVVSSLRLLVDIYKLASDRFKDKKTPERIEEIVVRAEQASPRTADKAEIERSIAEALDPGDAAIVKSDLELLSLLLVRAPALEAFDYWGKLNRLVTGLQVFAKNNRLFELRGAKRFALGEALWLPRTSKCILPDERAAQLAAPYRMEDLRATECLAFLQKDAAKFPIVVAVGVQFNSYSSIGGPPSVHGDQCFFDIGPGQQPHWLMFDRGERFNSHFGHGCEYMLQASDFISIVQALRDDIQEYATAIQADEQKVASLFAAIDAFAESIAPLKATG